MLTFNDYRVFWVVAVLLGFFVIGVGFREVSLFAESKESAKTDPKSVDELVGKTPPKSETMTKSPFGGGSLFDELKSLDAFHQQFENRFKQMMKGFDEDDSLFTTPFTNSWKGMGGTSLNSSVREDNGKIVVTVDLPGHTKDSIHLRIKDNALVLKSERKSETANQDEKAKTYRNEISYGSFTRVIELPKKVVEDKIEAKYDNGVLMVTAPIDSSAPVETDGKKIEVK